MGGRGNEHDEEGRQHVEGSEKDEKHVAAANSQKPRFLQELD